MSSLLSINLWFVGKNSGHNKEITPPPKMTDFCFNLLEHIFFLFFFFMTKLIVMFLNYSVLGSLIILLSKREIRVPCQDA